MFKNFQMSNHFEITVMTVDHRYKIVTLLENRTKVIEQTSKSENTAVFK